MSWLRRRDRAEDDADPGREAASGGGELDGDGEDADPEAARVAALQERRRRRGPFDASEVEPGSGRIDLGALRVAAPAGTELRLEVEEATKRVVAATIGMPGSSVQVHVFAAPRTEGVWDEVREEIAASVVAQGGTAEVVEVPDGFGRELLARLPARTADGRTGHVATRFTGVDGPRWFLRAVFAGGAALDRAAAAPLEAVVRAMVVVRGEEAMAPRDLLPLRLPPGATPRPVPARAAPPSGAVVQPAQAQQPQQPAQQPQQPAQAQQSAQPQQPDAGPPVPVGPGARQEGRS